MGKGKKRTVKKTGEPAKVTEVEPEAVGLEEVNQEALTKVMTILQRMEKRMDRLEKSQKGKKDEAKDMDDQDEVSDKELDVEEVDEEEAKERLIKTKEGKTKDNTKEPRKGTKRVDETMTWKGGKPKKATTKEERPMPERYQAFRRHI